MLLGFGSAPIGGNGNFFQRMGNAVCGVFVGMALFVGTLAVIFWNEGVAVKTARTLDAGLKQVKNVGCSPIDESMYGSLVHISCPISNLKTFTVPNLGLVVNGTWIKADISQYAWAESKDTKDQSGQKVTVYDYTKAWRTSPVDSSIFNKQSTDYRTKCQNPGTACGQTSPCCNNPPGGLPTTGLPTATLYAENLQGGAFHLGTVVSKEFSKGSKLNVPDRSTGYVNQMTWNDARSTGSVPSVIRTDNTIVSGSTFYTTNTPSNPRIGDIKVSLQYGTATQVSVVARQKKWVAGEDSNFDKWPSPTDSGYSVFLVSESEQSAEEMFSDAQDRNKARTWAIRIIMWLLNWLSLQMITGPIALMPEAIPCIGSCIGGLVGCVLCIATCFISSFWCLLVLGIAWIYYYPKIGIPLVVAAVICLCLFLYFRKKKGNAKVASDGYNAPGEVYNQGGYAPPQQQGGYPPQQYGGGYPPQQYGGGGYPPQQYGGPSQYPQPGR